MCGIAGLSSTIDAAAALRRMLDCLAHRGPDDAGTWTFTDGSLSLGHRRLSIIELSAAGHQPMKSATGRFVITFNGEIYNHVAMRADLEDSGTAPAWRGHSDTEVLLAGFEAWGIQTTLRRANGMFAFAVFDTLCRELTLARDRMGEKPLYFGWLGGGFAFASELRALREAPGWTAQMHPGAIDSFLVAGHVRGPQSAINGVYRLPPGTSFKLADHEFSLSPGSAWIAARIEHYWSLNEVALSGLSNPFEGGMDEASAALEALLVDSIRLRMMADVPIGTFLSGGIDSSLITALMQAQSSLPVRTFSIGFAERSFDEAPYARAIAQHLGTEHSELYVDAQDALGLVPTLSETFDEPFADHSQIPTLLVSRLARPQVTVALTGDGGDELFAGYGRYFAILRLWRVLGAMPPALRRAASPALALSAMALAPLARMPLPGRSLPSRLDRLSERVAVPGADALRLSFIAGAGGSSLRGTATMPEPDCASPPAQMHDVLRRLMYADQIDYLPDNMLHKVDRASMAYGLEARVPFLDHRVVEFSWHLPLRMLASGHRGKLLLRHILHRHVPRALFERQKQGFSPPLGAWLRGPLRSWAEALLSADSLRELPMLEAGVVQSLWRSHQALRTDASQTLWKVLMLADWRQRLGANL